MIHKKNIIKKASLYLAIGGVGMLFARGCNNVLNNNSISTTAYRSDSFATGVSGHVDYIRYSDGSRDVITYPGFFGRYFDSELYQDLNGDGQVDRIRQTGPEIKMNNLKLLIRARDYPANKTRFDEADERLSELIGRFEVK